MSALRDTDGKLDWAMLFEYFPLSLPELCKARMFGARHYTKDGKDGRSNWRESINTDKHEEFFKGCIRGNISHNLKCLWGEDRDIPQDNVHHLAFGALNDLMALEYALARQELSTQECEDILQAEIVCEGSESEDPMSNCDNFDFGEVVKKSRYPWEDAPAWAACGAIDADGIGDWHESKPTPSEYLQWTARDRVERIGDNMLRKGEDWRTTLEERPKC